MLTMFLGTGIRVSELVGLNIDDLNFETNGFLVTRKGDHEQILYFPEESPARCRNILPRESRWRSSPGMRKRCFVAAKEADHGARRRIHGEKIRALQVAPLKRRMSPHKLRSTFGTNLYRATGDIYLVADVLGHTDINTTGGTTRPWEKTCAGARPKT
jgi:site-specific recombinase XerD